MSRNIDSGVSDKRGKERRGEEMRPENAACKEKKEKVGDGGTEGKDQEEEEREGKGEQHSRDIVGASAITGGEGNVMETIGSRCGSRAFWLRGASGRKCRWQRWELEEEKDRYLIGIRTSGQREKDKCSVDKRGEEITPTDRAGSGTGNRDDGDRKAGSVSITWRRNCMTSNWLSVVATRAKVADDWVEIKKPIKVVAIVSRFYSGF